MDFLLSDDQKLIADTARKVGDRFGPRLLARARRQEEFPGGILARGLRGRTLRRGAAGTIWRRRAGHAGDGVDRGDSCRLRGWLHGRPALHDQSDFRRCVAGALRFRGDEIRIAAQNHRRRHQFLHGFHRARCRLEQSRNQDVRDARRQRLAAQRPQDLDHRRRCRAEDAGGRAHDQVARRQTPHRRPVDVHRRCGAQGPDIHADREARHQHLVRMQRVLRGRVCRRRRTGRQPRQRLARIARRPQHRADRHHGGSGGGGDAGAPPSRRLRQRAARVRR